MLTRIAPLLTGPAALVLVAVGGCRRSEPTPSPPHAGVTPSTVNSSSESGRRAQAATTPSRDLTQPRAPHPVRQERPTPCLVPLVEPAPPPSPPAEVCPPDPVADPPSLPRARVVFPEAPGSPAVDVEWARTTSARQRGLMYRTSLGASDGMLFSWPDARPRSFWMHDTCLPLDMLFIASDGTITGILEQVPTLNDEPRGIPCPTQHVLEVNAGFTRAAGIRPGQQLRIEE